MDTYTLKNFDRIMDNLDRIIGELRAGFESSTASEIERHWTKFALNKRIAERDALLAELRASPEWGKLPF